MHAFAKASAVVYNDDERIGAYLDNVQSEQKIVGMKSTRLELWIWIVPFAIAVIVVEGERVPRGRIIVQNANSVGLGIIAKCEHSYRLRNAIKSTNAGAVCRACRADAASRV